MDTNDIELLELAAKAAGYKFSDYTFKGEDGICLVNPPKHNWNPLEDGGDAFRLAVNLIKNRRARHAIVRAAAEIGKEML